MRPSRLAFTVLLAAVVVLTLGRGLRAQGQPAQNLPFSLFERYLQSIRQQAGIPGLSAAIVQDRRIVWERGFGYQDVESAIPATPITPYPIADLTQTFAAILVFQHVEEHDLDLDAPISKWTTTIPEPEATVRQVLSHTSHAAQAQFRYDPARYAALTPVIEAFGREPYRTELMEEFLDRLGMADSVPGTDLAEPSAAVRQLYDAATLERYGAVLRRMATPYRIDSKGKPWRSEPPPKEISAATGIVSTVRDLARYDAALDDQILVEPEDLELQWTNVVSAGGQVLPVGLGWFVQNYNGQRVVWHFGMAKDAYSSLLIKVPARNLTLILLANSDGLAAPSTLAAGDVTTSLIGKLFLYLFA